MILEAEGRAQAIASVYAAIKEQAPDPTLVAILQLDTLAKFADSPNTKLIIPAESSALLGAVQAIRSVDGTDVPGSHRPVTPRAFERRHESGSTHSVVP